MASAVRAFVIISLHFVIAVYTFQEYNLYENDNRAIVGRRLKRSDKTQNRVLFDLEDHIRKKLQMKYKSQNQVFEWVAMNGSHPDLPGNLAKSRVGFEVKNVKKGDPTNPTQRVSGLFSNLYCNSQSMPLSSSINQLIKRNATFTYRANRGLKRVNEDNAMVVLRIPPSLQIETKPVPEMKINLLGKNSNGQSVVDEVKLSHTVSVPPGKAKVVNITVIHTEVQIQYEADLVISGSVVAKYKEKDGKSKFAAHKVSEFSDSNFAADGDNLVFHTDGSFKGSRATNVSILENEMSADMQQCKHEELQSQGPIRIIHMKPEAKKEEDLTQ